MRSNFELTVLPGCTPDDSQGNITPILVDPNFDDYSCSDIPTQPDDTEIISYW